MKPFFLIFTLLLTAPIFCQSKYAKTSVYFETDNYDLQDDDRLLIDKFLADFDDRIIQKIILKGNTDSDADSLYNITLSKNRSEAVKSYLVSKAVDGNIVEYKYYGENKPIATNITDPGKQQNRRVDIIAVWIPKPVVVEVKEKIIDEVVPEEKCLEGDTTFTLEGGSIITMDRCEYLKKKDCIKFNEVVSYEQIVESGMTTIDDKGNTMVTGGMFSMTIEKDCGECPKVKILVPEVFCPFSQLMIWDIGPDGRWTNPVPARSVRMNDKNYTEMELSCNGRWKNADCKMPHTCPCWKENTTLADAGKFEVEAYGKFELTEIRVAFNNPISVSGEENGKGKKSFSLTAMPHAGDPLLNAVAMTDDNRIMIMINKPLSELQHTTLPAGNNLFLKYYITENDFDIIATNDINYRF